jgi:hypothetical protein
MKYNIQDPYYKPFLTEWVTDQSWYTVKENSDIAFFYEDVMRPELCFIFPAEETHWGFILTLPVVTFPLPL